MEFGSLGDSTRQLAPCSLVMNKNKNSNTFDLSTRGRVGISKSNPEEKHDTNRGRGVGMFEHHVFSFQTFINGFHCFKCLCRYEIALG